MSLPLRYAPNFIRLIAWTAFALLGIALIVIPGRVLGADPGACVVYADYALTAAALAKQERAGNLPRPVADAILADIYVIPPRLEPYRKRIESDFERIRRDADAARAPPGDYAAVLYLRCVQTGGVIDRFIGVDS